MTTKSLFLFAPVLLLFFCSSCVSLTSMQTARTLEKGKVQLQGGVSTMAPSTSTDNEDFDFEMPIYGHTVEFGTRIGVGKKFDVGAKLSSGAVSGVKLDAKWQFLGDRESKFAMATGVGLGFGLGTWKSADEDFGDNSFSNLQAYLPLYLSAHPTEKLSIYCNPQFIYQSLGTDIYDFNEEASHNFLYGGSIGVMYGKKIKVVLETSVFQYHTTGLESSVLLPQIGVGAIFQL